LATRQPVSGRFDGAATRLSDPSARPFRKASTPTGPDGHRTGRTYYALQCLSCRPRKAIGEVFRAVSPTARTMHSTTSAENAEILKGNRDRRGAKQGGTRPLERSRPREHSGAHRPRRSCPWSARSLPSFMSRRRLCEGGSRTTDGRGDGGSSRAPAAASRGSRRTRPTRPTGLTIHRGETTAGPAWAQTKADPSNPVTRWQRGACD
jgi:hypothetical protein